MSENKLIQIKINGHPTTFYPIDIEITKSIDQLHFESTFTVGRDAFPECNQGRLSITYKGNEMIDGECRIRNSSSINDGYIKTGLLKTLAHELEGAKYMGDEFFFEEVPNLKTFVNKVTDDLKIPVEYNGHQNKKIIDDVEIASGADIKDLILKTARSLGLRVTPTIKGDGISFQDGFKPLREILNPQINVSSLKDDGDSFDLCKKYIVSGYSQDYEPIKSVVIDPSTTLRRGFRKEIEEPLSKSVLSKKAKSEMLRRRMYETSLTGRTFGWDIRMGDLITLKDNVHKYIVHTATHSLSVDEGLVTDFKLYRQDYLSLGA